MNRHSLEKLLQQDAPPPDPAARLAARHAALAEFARLHAAPANEPRPIVGPLPSFVRRAASLP